MLIYWHEHVVLPLRRVAKVGWFDRRDLLLRRVYLYWKSAGRDSQLLPNSTRSLTLYLRYPDSTRKSWGLCILSSSTPIIANRSSIPAENVGSELLVFPPLSICKRLLMVNEKLVEERVVTCLNNLVK